MLSTHHDLSDALTPLSFEDYALKSQNILTKAYFELQYEQPLVLLLELTTTEFLVSFDMNSSQSPRYSLPLDEHLKYRLVPLKYNILNKSSWKLILFTQQLRLPLIAQLDSSPEAWDKQLRKNANKLGFNEDFKPLRLISSAGKVYKVQRIRDGQQFAVKAFSKKAFEQNPRLRESLINQIELMRQLSIKSCSEVLSLHQVYQSQNSLYLVMELCPGGTLGDRRYSGASRLQNKVVKHIMGQLLKGAAHIHGHNIAHRDLKPHNILFRNRQKFEVVIADMGLATRIDAQDYLFSRCGTPGYVAPQVLIASATEKLFNPHCDIFSLGTVFYYLLTGKQLFEGSSPQEVLQKNKQMSFNLDCQKEIIDENALCLLRKMLEKNPYERISAQDALKEPYFESEELKIQVQQNGIKIQEKAISLMQTDATSQVQVQSMQIEDGIFGLSRDKKKQYRKASHL